MKKIKKLPLCVLLGLLASCTQDQQNQLSRKVVELLDSDYRVTYANGNTEKSWIIKNGKVTTSEKGYYYFWDEHRHYIQVPVQNAFIEEIDH